MHSMRMSLSVCYSFSFQPVARDPFSSSRVELVVCGIDLRSRSTSRVATRAFTLFVLAEVGRKICISGVAIVLVIC